ncbi:DUF6340 family protein [uncultured Sanguibacteroides sp.]|uniref:DUF6340 family protein n=1 Tax=uncultured Sanguibacteroides sp. TaxID=1635151 RepID=UPI0025F40EF1|nr:DUF6340 family protein [uncultured Sanguibacteroides sp.]
MYEKKAKIIDRCTRGVILFLVFSCLTSCVGYRLLDIDVLEPADRELKQGDIKILFLDRKLIYRSDSLSLRELRNLSGLIREDLVECFYDGFQAGIHNSAKKVVLGRAIGLNNRYMSDTTNPAPLTLSELQTVNKGSYSYVLGVESCMFRLYDRYNAVVDNALFLRLYDTESNQPIDTMHSNILRSAITAGEDINAICDFYYQLGIEYAKHLVPTWQPEKRRIYLGNNTLKLGYYFLKDEKYDQAYEIWSAALHMRPLVAVKATVNLAWLYERQGNFQGAIDLLNAALEHMEKYNVKNSNISEYIENYIQILNQRIKDDRKLLNQL